MMQLFRGIIPDWKNVVGRLGFWSENKALFEKLLNLYEETRGDRNLAIYEVADLFFEWFVDEPWNDVEWRWSNDDFYREPFTLWECPNGFYDDECNQVSIDVNEFWSRIFWDSEFLNKWLKKKLNTINEFYPNLF